MAKSKVQFKDEELQYIRSFYEQEKFQLLSRLQHVDQVLGRLNGGGVVITNGVLAAPQNVSAAQPPVVAPAPKRKRGRPRKTEAVVETKPKKAGRPKKRGPKSVWGNFILRRLRQCDRPLSYSELVRDAMVMHNLPAAKEKNAKASILNAAFRLRTHLDKVDTVGLPGKKERFLVMKSWLAAEGQLKAPYDGLFKEIASTPMDDRGRKPRRPSATSRAESKVKSRLKAAGTKAASKSTSTAAPKATPKPAAKKAVAKKPAAKQPAAKQPVAKKAVAKKPAAKKPVAKQPVAKKPVAKKPVARKPSAKAAVK